MRVEIMLEDEQTEALELMWDKMIFIGTRECRVRDLISDPSEAERRPELELQKAQAKYTRMLQKGMVDYSDETYLVRKFSKLSAFHVQPKELQRRTDFWFKKWCDACAKLRATEQHLAALDREIELVEHQKAEMQEQACSRLTAATSKCGNRFELCAFFTKRRQP